MPSQDFIVERPEGKLKISLLTDFGYYLFLKEPNGSVYGVSISDRRVYLETYGEKTGVGFENYNAYAYSKEGEFPSSLRFRIKLRPFLKNLPEELPEYLKKELPDVLFPEHPSTMVREPPGNMDGYHTLMLKLWGLNN